MLDENLETKLQQFVANDKPKYITINGEKKYISRKFLERVKEKKKQKEGGFLPLIPLFAGLAAAGSLAGGAAGIAKAVQDKQASDAEQREEERHNKAMEKVVQGKGYTSKGEYIPNEHLSDKNVGNGLKEHIKNFVEKTGLEQEAKKGLKKVLKVLADTIGVEKNGEGLYLNPHGKGFYLNPKKEV